MDILHIIGTKVKNLFEHKLGAKDFVYQPLFPAFTSICFTFINAKFFHLNTVLETTIGSIFLIILGYKYQWEMSFFLSSKSRKIWFGFLIAFIIFGLHKWEAFFTPFFSFAVFFDLTICMFSYFFIVKYSSEEFRGKSFAVVWFVFFNLLIILEAPAYFFSYILSILLLLFLIRSLQIIEINRRRFHIILYSTIGLLIMALALVGYLSIRPELKSYAVQVSIKDFFRTLIEKPVWVIKFYLIANSGPFWGEAFNRLTLRSLAGFFILSAYAFAIWHVIKTRDKRLLIPMSLIFYSIISYAFIAVSRYYFNSVEYGSSSRYTAFNLSGVLGLATIIFFYLFEVRSRINYCIAWLMMAFILVGYVFVDFRQLKISKYRTSSFRDIRETLLSKKNLQTLQADKESALSAIAVLKRYKLNVYYDANKRGPNFNLAQHGSFVISPASKGFNKLNVIGLHEYERDNKFSWTNGSVSIGFYNFIETPDNLTAQLDTYMPDVCRGIIPEVFAVDENDSQYHLTLEKREGDSFFYSVKFEHTTAIQRLNILSDTIDAPSDLRTLSFPFKRLEVRRK